MSFDKELLNFQYFTQVIIFFDGSIKGIQSSFTKMSSFHVEYVILFSCNSTISSNLNTSRVKSL